MEITKAVIPAAGFGTRFFPVTKSQPKEMMPVLDKPTIQYIVRLLIRNIRNGKNTWIYAN